MERHQVAQLCERDVLESAARLFGTTKASLRMYEDYQGCANLVYEYEHGERSYILRGLYRPDRSVEQVQAELHFINYLAEGGVRVSRPIASTKGNLLEVIDADGIRFIFVSFVKGKGMRVPDNGYRYRSGAPLEEYFQNWGQVLGQMHRLAKTYVPPSPLVRRPEWYSEAGFHGLPYRERLPSIDEKYEELLAELRALPQDAESYGLIHNDFNDGNFTVDYDNGNITVYDFDDACYFWFMYTNNKLSSITGNNLNITFQYNGVGDRVNQTLNGVTTNYVLDQAAELTQVLQDRTNTYLYGNGRIAQQGETATQYYLGDALGSVRHLVDASGNLTLAQSYEPYGDILASEGTGETDYAFTGESYNAQMGLLYLRARYLDVRDGRFLSRDSWTGDAFRPMSHNKWMYVFSNPVNLIDPSGMSPDKGKSGNEVVKFIVQKMREDSKSEAIKEVHELNSTHYFEEACDLYSRMSWWEKSSVGGSRFLTDAAYADAGARAAASAKFGCLVADARSRPVCGQWDYKADISVRWQQAQTVDFSAIGIDEEVIFYYDIWANFHFGYLGMVGGFSEETLLTGAAVEHAASNLKVKIQDDSSDVVANLVGIQMYKFNTLSETTLLGWIYLEKDKLNKVRFDENGNFEVYQ